MLAEFGGSVYKAGIEAAAKRVEHMFLGEGIAENIAAAIRSLAEGEKP